MTDPTDPKERGSPFTAVEGLRGKEMNENIGNLEYYKVFYCVVKAGSITGAASQLAISQPAVSQSIRQLEEILETKLFIRGSGGVKLTDEGEILFSYVGKGYEQMLLGVDKIRQLRNLTLGEIRIGASDMTLQYYLLPYLERFHEQYPEIKVKVTNAPTPETLNLLTEGAIDFGVVSTPFAVDSRIHSVTVRQVEDIFVAGRRFISYKNRTLDLQELEKLPLVCLEKNTSTRSCMDAFLLQNGVVIKPEFELATSDMIVQFAERNLGVGCVVREFAQPLLDKGVLFELRFNQMIPRRSFCVVSSVKVPQSAAAKKLMEIMEIENDSEYCV